MKDLSTWINMKTLQTGKIAIGNDFLGRKKIIQEIDSYLGMSQSVVLTAPRRYGKSSIIAEIVNRNTYHLKIISVDIMKIHSKRALAEHIIDEAYGAIGIKGIIKKLQESSIEFFKTLMNHLTSIKLTIDDISIETTDKLLKETNEDKLLEYALELPEQIAAKIGQKFLFIIDEFGEIDKLQSKNELIETMRTVFQVQQNVLFIFAGSQYALMTKIFIDKDSAFHKFAVQIEVPVMKAKDFQQKFKEVFYAKEVSIPSDFAELVEEISQGIPYYMVRVAQQVLIDALLKGEMNTYCFSIRAAALKVFKKEQSYFAAELSKFRGKKHDMTTLKALSLGKNHTQELEKHGVSRQNANAIVKTLLLTGVIEKKSNKYIITDPFLRRYVSKL